MKLCLSCHEYHATILSECPLCRKSPEFLDGFEAYAADMAYEGGGFKENYFEELAQLEADNFWFQSRNKLILWALQKYSPNFQSFLEIGCGTGFVLSDISKKFPHAELNGSEIFLSGLEFASSRLPQSKFMQMDARKIPFENEFDAIGAFDVLEHVKEDNVVLNQIYKALKPNGVMVLTVPQHEWLWSRADEYACHERRYTAAALHSKVMDAGFKITRSTSFVTSLLPAMMASRLIQKKRTENDYDPTAELKISKWLNTVFSSLLSIEQGLIKLNINLPVGGSRLVVAKKV